MEATNSSTEAAGSVALPTPDLKAETPTTTASNAATTAPNALTYRMRNNYVAEVPMNVAKDQLKSWAKANRGLLPNSKLCVRCDDKLDCKWMSEYYDHIGCPKKVKAVLCTALREFRDIFGRNFRLSANAKLHFVKDDEMHKKCYAQSRMPLPSDAEIDEATGVVTVIVRSRLQETLKWKAPDVRCAVDNIMMDIKLQAVDLQFANGYRQVKVDGMTWLLQKRLPRRPRKNMKHYPTFC